MADDGGFCSSSHTMLVVMDTACHCTRIAIVIVVSSFTQAAVVVQVDKPSSKQSEHQFTIHNTHT